MNFSNVARFEPPLVVLNEKVFGGFVRHFVIAVRNGFAANQNFSLRVWLVGDSVVAFFPVDQPQLNKRRRSANTATRHVANRSGSCAGC